MISDQLDVEVARAFFGGFVDLRPAQAQAIPPICAGENVVISSGTGSGKTEAAVAPLINQHWRKARLSDEIVLLYITPTKALANDIKRRLLRPMGDLGLRVGVRHGDRDDLRSGSPPHLLITTPESLDVLLARNDPALSTISGLIVDEVHLLYNTQRGLQLGILLQRLRQRLAGAFQWVALSATIADLSAVRDFLFGPSEAASFIACPTNRPIDVQIRRCRDFQDLAHLCHRLTSDAPTKLLVFVNSRRACDQLADNLAQVSSPSVPTFAHYSSLSASLRVKTEQQFAAATSAICIATSTLELGIDIGDIDAVILWGAPGGTESFLQRIGRGNRRAAKSNVIGLVPDDANLPLLEALKLLAMVDTSRSGLLPLRKPYHLYGALAQQCISMVAARDGGWVKISEVADLVRPFECLDRSTCENVIGELGAAEYVTPHGFRNQFGGAEQLYKLVDYRMIYGNFPIGSQSVELHHGSECLGEVPAINLLRVRRGDLVRFAGRRWRVKSADAGRIDVEPSSGTGAAVDFQYGTGAPSCDPFITNWIWRMVHSDEMPLADLQADLRSRVQNLRDRLRVGGGLDTIPCFASGMATCYLTFAGSAVNKAISLISEQDAPEFDDVGLVVGRPIDWDALPTRAEDYQPIFHRLFEANSGQTVFQSLLPPELQMREFLQSWLKDPLVPEILTRLAASSIFRIDRESAGELTEL